MATTRRKTKAKAAEVAGTAADDAAGVAKRLDEAFGAGDAASADVDAGIEKALEQIRADTKATTKRINRSIDSRRRRLRADLR